MRLWSIHPQYLDSKGLTACWREGLLARKVLSGQTRGYRHHPQLERFKNTIDPIEAIDSFLWNIWDEAHKRGYTFDLSKIKTPGTVMQINVTSGQIQYEWNLLKQKLQTRNLNYYNKIKDITGIKAHPLFSIKEGDIETWEKI